jgi:hypothetical protein
MDNNCSKTAHSPWTVCVWTAVQGGEELPKEARLFQLSNATGSVRVDEVSNFAQVGEATHLTVRRTRLVTLCRQAL